MCQTIKSCRSIRQSGSSTHRGSLTQKFFYGVSLLELFFLIYFASGVIDGDLYKMYIFGLALLKHVPENILKHGVFTHDSLKQYNRRPAAAYNCNSMNAGGVAAENLGMPSGHTTVMTMYFTLHLSNLLYITKRLHKSLNIRSIVLLVVFFGGMVLIAIARWHLECHTVPQIVMGWVLGVLLGLAGFGISCAICEKSPLFKEAFLRFYSEPTMYDNGVKKK